MARNPDVKKGLEEFVARQIRREPDASVSRQSGLFLARVLASTSTHKEVVDEYIKDLRGGSMQSPDELIKASRALGCEPGGCGIVPTELKPIFDIRNDIIHELDMDLTGTRRKRNLRSQGSMIGYVHKLLEVAQSILCTVDAFLVSSS